jgi:hypothetical protein
MRCPGQNQQDSRESNAVDVRRAAGQPNVSITSAYLHVAVEDGEVGNLFGLIAETMGR